MINVTNRQTHTLHHSHSKVKIERYTQTHIILLVISIIIAIMPRMTRRWTFCWHKGGVSAAALDRTHNFEVQENHNGCWNTPISITLNIINQLEGSNPWTKVNNNNNTMVVEIHPSPLSTTLKGIMTTVKARNTGDLIYTRQVALLPYLFSPPWCRPPISTHPSPW